MSGEAKVVEFTSGHLALAVRLLSYAPQTAVLLPLLIHEAQANDNLVPLAAQAEMVSSMLGESIAYCMHNAVVCTEDLPFVDEGAVDREALRKSYLGEEMLEDC